MKRKVVQHGPSTLIISLPSKWIKNHNVKKGDELDVSEIGNDIVVRNSNIVHSEKIEFNATPFGGMIPRVLHALYKRGANDITLLYDNPETFKLIEKSLGKEAVGFEILETSKNYCLIKNVSEGTKEFGQVMRQTFLLLLSMADEGYLALKQGNLSTLNNLITLEKTNNRFTTFCRRYLNIRGSEDYDKIGPLYYIVEQIESIGDIYKYLYTFLSKPENKKTDINKELLNNFNDVNQMLRKFYTVFYKFNPKLLAELKDDRNKIINSLYNTLPQVKKPVDVVMFHHTMMLATEIFNLAGPYLILAFKNYATNENGKA